MKLKLLLIFLLTSFCLNAQKKADKLKRNHKINPLSLDLYYGKSIFRENFYSQLNSINARNFSLPVQQIGIGFSNAYVAATPWISFSNQMNYTYFMTNKVLINDTIQSNISGFSYACGFGKAFFKKSNIFRLTAYLGFNTGRTKLTQFDNLNVKNQFFAPKILLQPKIILKHFCFSMMIDYAWDLSHPNWKKMYLSKSKYNLNTFNQSKMTILLSLGYCPYNNVKK